MKEKHPKLIKFLKIFGYYIASYVLTELIILMFLFAAKLNNDITIQVMWKAYTMYQIVMPICALLTLGLSYVALH